MKKAYIIPLILFLLGTIFTIIGALFKIMHWPYGSLLLIIGSAAEVCSILILIFFLIKSMK